MPADNDILAGTLDWARQHLDEPLTVEQLARHASVSVRTLHRHFLGRAGVKPLEWLNAQRVQRAQQLLETTDAPVERVATACGFGNAATLRRHFRRILGTSPDAYRRTFTTNPEAGGTATDVLARQGNPECFANEPPGAAATSAPR